MCFFGMTAPLNIPVVSSCAWEVKKNKRQAFDANVIAPTPPVIWAAACESELSEAPSHIWLFNYCVNGLSRSPQ